jgi:signal transduction histidine kinase
MLGGTVEVYRTGTPPAVSAAAGSSLQFTQEIAGSPDWQVRVTFATPALIRVQILHQRILAVIVLLSLLLAIVPLLLVLVDSRRALGPDGGTRSPWRAAKAQAVGMEHFAKISNERSAALTQEHNARLRAEQDLQINRTLLDRSVDERIRLGRELHDNICQTLYAVCLTLESVQKKNTLAPELKQRVDQCMTELRRLNQEVRSFLQELEPARVHGQSFAGALTGLIESFATDEDVQIEQRLDEEAVALIPPQQFAEVMSLLREAVSNSLRHGRARRITLLAGRNDQQIALAVQDDGAGFTPTAPRSASSHGLDNMQARAAALGGSLQIESVPGKGTRVLLTLPVASPS